MKTYYTEKGWHLAAIEDPRNPSFNIVEITLEMTGDTLVVTTGEYADIERWFKYVEGESADDQVMLTGEEWYGTVQDILDCITVYKIID